MTKDRAGILKNIDYHNEISEPKVSVIIPTYNDEKFIDRCIQSVLTQTLEEIEVIVINDGSTDSTREILSEYEYHDSRVKVIDQENQKQGAARNKGLEISRGKYIAFVDADDWIDRDYLELLYNAAEKYNVNIAAATATRDYENKVKYHLKFDEEKTYFGADNIIAALKNELITHSKIYRFDAIRNLRYEEQVRYEDGPYTIKAIYQCDSMVTVPNAHYHYYSNPNSTIKQKRKINNENDKISTSIEVIDFAREHNIKMKEWMIIKEENIFWKIKHYKDYKEYYFCGIKICTKQIPFDNSRTFLVFNTAYLGDVLLCNSLCRNIKNAFPNSKVVFITSPSCKDAAMYQDCVDDVGVYDKKGIHKGIFGLIRFIKDFKYKNIYASFITYRSNSNRLLAKLLKSRFIQMGMKGNYPISSQMKHNMLLMPFTNKNIHNLPIKYNVPSGIANKVRSITNEPYIVLCTTSKRIEKDMPVDTAADLIKKITSETSYKVVFAGVGQSAVEYSEKLKSAGCDFVDLVNQTSIIELGVVLKDANGVISVDTGTLHYALAVDTPVCAVFYEDDKIANWAPDARIYKSVLVDKHQTVQNIYTEFMALLNRENEQVANV